MLNSTLAVCVATFGPYAINAHYEESSLDKDSPTEKLRNQSVYAGIQKNKQIYNRTASYSNTFMLRTGRKINQEEIGMSDNMEFHKNISEPVYFSVRHAAKLSLEGEDEFSFNHEREYMQPKHVEKVSMSLQDGGKLTPGRDRA